MNLAQIEKVAKALGDETRLKLYEHIVTHDQVSCSNLVVLCRVSPATVSHHLKILSEAGLIACRREGQFVLNYAKPEVLHEFTSSVKELAAKKSRQPAGRQ